MTPTLETAARVPRILVVDDTPDNLFLMNGLLEDRWRVALAPSGREALEVIQSNDPPDLVLLDIMMPDMDGYEVLRRIRTHPPTANIPVIFLSALTGREQERLGMDLGAIDYLTKPIDPQQVLQRVEDHLRATTRAHRMEWLSEKLSRHLSAYEWQRLFRGPELAGIRFEEQRYTLVYAETTGLPAWGDRERDAFEADLHWLAVRHDGQVDPYMFGAALVYFEDPHAAIRMATELQRSAAGLMLPVGIHSASCVLAHFTIDGMPHTTLVGPQALQAARVAATAAGGSIAISPDAYALVQDTIRADAGPSVVMEEFQDSDLAQASLTPAPQRGGQGPSTFAGLGRTGS
jgi:CheY-like chemotaxis protein